MKTMVASGTAAHEAAPGLFLLVWGLFASVIGLGLVTNFRGVPRRVHSGRVRVVSLVAAYSAVEVDTAAPG